MLEYFRVVESLPVDAPLPVREEPVRMFVYSAQGAGEALEKASDFTVVRLNWATAKLLADGPELRAAWDWRLRHRPAARTEDYEFFLYRVPHQDYPCEPCLVAAVEYREDASWYIASRVELRQLAKIENITLVAIHAFGEHCWNRFDGAAEWVPDLLDAYAGAKRYWRATK